MKTLKMYASSVNDRFLDQTVESLEEGNLIIYPTDTLYAIGCDALDNKAIQSICRLKGINPDKQTLSIVASDISMASDYARIDNKAFDVLRRNTPGPFTFLLPASPSLPKVFKGRRIVGIRIPDNAIATAIVSRLGHPILSTTINPDEDADYQDPQHFIGAYANDVDLIVDGGEGGVIPSTVVNLTDSSSPEIIRQGKGELQ